MALLEDLLPANLFLDLPRLKKLALPVSPLFTAAGPVAVREPTVLRDFLGLLGIVLRVFPLLPLDLVLVK